MRRWGWRPAEIAGTKTRRVGEAPNLAASAYVSIAAPPNQDSTSRPSQNRQRPAKRRVRAKSCCAILSQAHQRARQRDSRRLVGVTIRYGVAWWYPTTGHRPGGYKQMPAELLQPQARLSARVPAEPVTPMAAPVKEADACPISPSSSLP